MKVISERRQHRDESVAPICQRKDTGFVEDGSSVGDGGEQPIDVVLIDALREESDDTEEVTGAGTKFAECRRSKRKFDRCCQALVVVRLKDLHTVCIPLPGQSIVIPHVVRCGGGEQRDRECMEI